VNIAAISTSEISLKKLHQFSKGKDFFSRPDFILFQQKAASINDAVEQLKNKKDLSIYDLFLLSDLDSDQEIAAALAVTVDAGCLTMCSDVSITDGVLKVKREVFGGLARLNLSLKKKPFVITLSSAILGGNEVEDSTLQFEHLDAAPLSSKIKVLSTTEIQKTVDLTSARKIVSVGRGIGKQEHIEIAEKLARKLDAELGCSRPLSEDYKWLPVERQVGLTGETVKPELYIAIGISGQVQHIVGMRDSKIVVAINNNKSAPIFEYCDYGLVGDLFELVPALSQMIPENH
jgi:electron transfer flavoprotein alpha subunit